MVGIFSLIIAVVYTMYHRLVARKKAFRNKLGAIADFKFFTYL